MRMPALAWQHQRAWADLVSVPFLARVRGRMLTSGYVENDDPADLKLIRLSPPRPTARKPPTYPFRVGNRDRFVTHTFTALPSCLGLRPACSPACLRDLSVTMIPGSWAPESPRSSLLCKLLGHEHSSDATRGEPLPQVFRGFSGSHGAGNGRLKWPKALNSRADSFF